MTRARDLADQINRINSSAADATALTIDSSENVLVGKTSVGAATAGFESRSTGYTAITRDGGQPLEVRRLTSDGDIVDFRTDGTTVGTIGGYGGQLIIGTGNTGLRFQNSIPAVIPRTTSDGASDGVYDLGDSNARFKDLYLSGGAFIGGTGSANKLDDYEEGTFTPTLTSGASSISYNHQYGFYTKVGRVVHFEFDLSMSAASGNSDLIKFGGLPYASANINQLYGGGFLNYQTQMFSTGADYMFHVGRNTQEVAVYTAAGNNFVGTSATLAQRLIMSGRYFAST